MQADQLWFEDFAPGQRYAGALHLLDAAAFAQFAQLTGDAHPIHYDEEYARDSRFGARVAHGLLLASVCALGATPLSARLRDAMVAFLEQGLRHTKAVLIGESVRPVFTVEQLQSQPGASAGRLRFRLHLENGAGEVVAEGFHDYLLRRRPKA